MTNLMVAILCLSVFLITEAVTKNVGVALIVLLSLMAIRAMIQEVIDAIETDRKGKP